MKVYACGGQIRDELLGLVPKDRDFVVTGATQEQMLDLGFKKVGADFPVFLEPNTGEEYALARRERSTGPGYNDFEVEFSPDVTIEEDLYRRDFTMNAIAKDIETREIIDPLDGQKHIKERKIVITNPKAFLEDPVRILRMARFIAQYPALTIEDETWAYAFQGDISDATAERVQLELIKALMGAKPSKFFDILSKLSGFTSWFPEVFDLIGVPQPLKYHLESCAYGHTMLVLDSAAKHNASLEVRFGCLVHDFGKATTRESWPSHPAHEIRGVPLVHAFCDRLKICNDLRKAGTKSAQYHMHVHKAFELKPKTYVKVFEDIKSDAINLAGIITSVAWHDNEGKLPWEHYGHKAEYFFDSIEELTGIKLSNEYSQEEIDTMSIDKRKQVLHNMRLKAIS